MITPLSKGYILFYHKQSCKYCVMDLNKYQNDQARFSGRVKIIEIFEHSWDAYNAKKAKETEQE